ncbi:WUSCHEL-related homeobox 1 PFS2-like protein [Vigna angularis]|uniref:WUSCHEL-related homeobox 1 PFS2-like protein n=1 Tax=Phaseolus angularis TaxID=3914 RepID=A0A8T0KJQ5_PHAAN|nr:WUSCHEL-related homeobox 1 PFS2-like protein [Vigna angularis]
MEAKTVHKRWRSTPEQVRILLNIYNHGIINPSRDQVCEITGRFQEYGEVGEYSVYCWFQNHGNRVKNRGWHQSIPGTSGSSFSLLPPYMYGKSSFLSYPSWVLPQTPKLLDLFPIPVIRKEEERVTQPMPFRTQAPSTKLSLRLSLANQQSP